MRRATALLVPLTLVVGFDLAGPAPLLAARPQRSRPAVLKAGASGFLLNGKPFQLVSGEVHYARVPRAYWRDRLRKARAMGLNAVSTPVFWNLHEPWPGRYDFAGDADVAAFARAAREEGLLVLLRPGPCVDAGWDMGGLPAWLLLDGKTVPRSSDPAFLAAVGRWFARLGKELAPLTGPRGGPIVAVQVEDGLGSFARDPAYLGSVRDALVAAGFGDALLFTTDAPGQLADGSLAGLPAAVSFGPGQSEAAFAALSRLRPKGPLMAGAFRVGGLDTWGRPRPVTDAAREARELGAMLAAGRSVNLSVFHGGTTFGLWNGARVTEEGYAPHATSHDADAALDEAGRPTPRFFAFRDAISRHRAKGSHPLRPLPAPLPLRPLPEVRMTDWASLWLCLPPAVEDERPRPMESVGQGRGWAVYQTIVSGPADGDLVVPDVHDWAAVYLDGRCIATLDRRRSQGALRISVEKQRARLDVLVESLGRVGSGPGLRSDPKGIGVPVTFAGKALGPWATFPLTMPVPPWTRLAPGDGPGPAFYRGFFRVEEPADTFLDMSGWEKGLVFVNGRVLGRHWSEGPQRTLYLPAPWLVKGENEVVVFEVETHGHRTVRGRTEPLLVEPVP